MASYSATIEVGTRGTAALEKLLARVNSLSGSIDKVNRSTVFGSKQVASLNEYNRALKEATANLAKTRVSLDKSGQAAGNYAKAIKTYVDALGSANGAQDLTNKLVQQEIQGREKATSALKKYNAAAASARQAGGSMAGRYLRPGQARGTTQFAGPIGPGQASSVFGGQSSAVEGRIKRILEMKKGELQLEKALIGLQQKSRGLDAASIADNNRILDIKAKEVSRNNEIIRQEKVKQSILRKRQRLEAAGRGPGSSGGGFGKRKFTDIATGAGFPLLFGGGPIQALAGGLGGAAGGLGGAIAASALVAQFEAFAKGAAEAGVALTSTSGALELVREKSLFTSEGTKNLAAQLEEQGDVAGLATLLTEELVSQIGNAGVIALQDLGTTTNETTKLWGQLTTQLQILIAGPLNGFLKLVNNMVGGINDALKPTSQDDFRAIRDRVRASGNEEDIARVNAIENQIRGTKRTNLRGGGTQVTQGSLTEEGASRGVDLLKAAGFGPKIAVKQEDLRTITPRGGSTKKDIVPGLKIQVQLQERLLGLNTKIAEAKRNGNEGAAAVLEVEKIFEKTAANIDKIKTEGLSKDAEALKIEEAQLKGLQQVEAVNNRMRDAKAKEAEKVKELVGNLENEGALIKAKLAGREDEVRLTQEIAEKTEGLGEADAKRVADLIRGNAELTKQVAIADKMQQIYDQIGQSIASGVVDTLSAAVDQTKSLADAAANTLRNIANILLQLGINTALQGTGLGIFKNLGGFADGGRPPVGKPSIVGERGPELFVPNTSGTIVPNNKLGGGGATNVVVNVDAKGSSASGDSGAGKQLGGLIGAAVQAELIKQQRPGGLLSR